MFALLELAVLFGLWLGLRRDFGFLTLIEAVKYVKNSRPDFAVDTQTLTVFGAFCRVWVMTLL